MNNEASCDAICKTNTGAGYCHSDGGGGLNKIDLSMLQDCYFYSCLIRILSQVKINNRLQFVSLNLLEALEVVKVEYLTVIWFNNSSSPTCQREFGWEFIMSYFDLDLPLILKNVNRQVAAADKPRVPRVSLWSPRPAPPCGL